MAGLGDLNRLPQTNGDGSEPAYRMSMLSFGTYKNSDGTESLGFALPAMIHEPLMAVERLFGSGNFAKGPDAPGNADDMRTLLFSMYGGNALNPVRAAEAKAMHDLPVYFSGERNPHTGSNFGVYHGPYEVGNAYTRDLGNTAQVGNIHIDPDYQGRGLGYGLMQYAEDQMGKPLIPDSTYTEPGMALARKYFGDDAMAGYSQPVSGGYYQQGASGLLSDAVKSMGHDDLIAALRARGTIGKAPQSGETLFSDNLPSIWGSALYPDQDPQGSYASGGNVADTSGLSGLRSIPDYGFGPMTPTTIAGRPNGFISSREPDPTWSDLALSAAEFPARATVGQFDAAGTGIADAIDDPSLANITNAGVQSGLAMMSPTLTAVSGLGGLGLAALRDADLIPSAEARRLHRAPHQAPPPPVAAPPEVDPVFEKIKDDPALLALYQQIQQTKHDATRMDYPGDGREIRAAAAQRLDKLNADFAATLAKRDAAKQGLYDQQVQNATAARDLELGRDRRFSDTEVGKVYDKLGGYAPLVAGFVPGVASRLAYGPAKTLGNALLRDAEGATFGIGANNVPLTYNAFATEVDNPEQRAYSAYAYNLPEGHPDKIKAQERADTLPKLNPVRTAANAELFDPTQAKDRAFWGALEGWGGNRFGQMLTGGIGGLFRRSSYQLPPGTGVAVKPQGPVSPAPLGASEELAGGKDEVLRRTSGPAGPASERSLPVLGDAADTVPVSPVQKPKGGRRSKPAGSKGPSKAGAVSSVSPPASSDKEAAASDELKRFLGFRKAPDLTDLKAAGGAVEGRGEGGKVFSGPLHSDVAGRTDHIPTTVRAGSFVVPADVVSALGESNTLAGTKVLDHMFPKQPEMLHYAAGGKVPILAAGGEYVIPPESVAQIGGGDLERGHNVLDQFVLNTRNDTIKTLKSLPGPSR